MLVLAVVGVLLGAYAPSAQAWWMWTPGHTVDDVGYKPSKPIPFSHKLHAGDLKMDCNYCHSAARRSDVAGIPPLNTCMGCHKIVRTDRPNIKKITEAFSLTGGEKHFLLASGVGEGLFFAGQSHVAIKIIASQKEFDIISQT